jgi:two-component system, chemotaxis family, chemotaxis protein CheY
MGLVDTPESRDRTVMVVEDEPAIRELVAEVLGDEGYAVLTAAHGAAALGLLDQHHPDVILLDMRMPVMDGWTFARAYRQRPAPHAPIVIMSAATDAQQWASEVEAQAVMPKPFDLEALVVTVDRYFRAHAISAPVELPAPAHPLVA